MSFALEGLATGSPNNCFWVRAWDIILDIGICSRNIVSINNLLLTHAHTDHSGGIIYYLSQRQLFCPEKCHIYIPATTVASFQKIIQGWEELENISYGYELIECVPNTRYPINRNYYFSTHPVRHRIPSTGYTIFESRQKILPQYLHYPPKEIAELKKTTKICEEVVRPILSYLGDCDFTSFEETPTFRESEYVILESTYIDAWKDTQYALTWKHIHLDQIFANPQLFEKNNKIILTHFSCRYTLDYIKHTVWSKCPESLRHKIIIWPTTQIINLATQKLDLAKIDKH